MRSLLILTMLLASHATAGAAQGNNLSHVNNSSTGGIKLPGNGVLLPKPTTPIEGAIDKDVLVGIKVELPFVIPGSAVGYSGVGNGGDYLRISFARAREYAANVVLRIKPNSLDKTVNAELRKWILDNQKFLAADIMTSEHVWTTEEKPSCGWTVMPDEGAKLPVANPIQLSYPTCRKSSQNFLQIAQLLIHEAVHHFRGDETAADKIAIGIIDAYRAGAMDSTPISNVGAPVATQKHSAVWTGDQMIVVGGFDDAAQRSVGTAYSYDPRADSWSNLLPPQSLGGRHDAAVTFTGKEVFVWGGFRKGASTEWTYDGAIYDLAAKKWTLIAKPSWWTPRSSTWEFDPRQTVISTGSKVIVWGGVDDKTDRPLGAIYDLVSKVWTKMNVDSPYAPSRLGGHSAVWTGSKMVVWGGYAGVADSNRAITNEGAVYDLAKNDWLATNKGGAPSARSGQQAVWTGSKMLIISGAGTGSTTDLSSTGGQYDIESGEWQTWSNELMAERWQHKAVWNGEEVLLIGGRSARLKTFFGEVYAYSPFTGRWRTLAGAGAPLPRVSPSIVWTGSAAIVWGGSNGDGKSQASGAVYYP